MTLQRSGSEWTTHFPDELLDSSSGEYSEKGSYPGILLQFCKHALIDRCDLFPRDLQRGRYPINSGCVFYPFVLGLLKEFVHGSTPCSFLVMVRDFTFSCFLFSGPSNRSYPNTVILEFQGGKSKSGVNFFHSSPHAGRIPFSRLPRALFTSSNALGAGSAGSWKWRWSALALVGLMVWALSDELHQWFVPSRTPSMVDVGLDTAGGILAQCVSTLWHRYAQPVGAFFISSAGQN
jgi:hypothetical protein